VSQHKIVTLEQLLPALQSSAKPVVFTNGCFDLLHVGHLRTLEWARDQGELLIVAINSDASVRALKGPSRPLTPERERAELLAGFACVDYVIIFSEDTPIRLLQQIRPDIHVKGGDYHPEQLPEAAVIKAYGGKVLVTPLIEGRSTSNLEKKLRENPDRRE